MRSAVREVKRVWIWVKRVVVSLAIVGGRGDFMVRVLFSGVRIWLWCFVGGGERRTAVTRRY